MHRGILTGALILCLINLSASSQPQPQTWHIVDQANHSGSETIRLLTTASTDTYISPGDSPQSALLQIKCSAPLTGSAMISLDSGSAATFAVKTDRTTTLAIRLDSDPAIHAGWANLSLHRILVYDLRDLLPAHQRMSIDLPIGASGLQSLTFDLSQLAPAMRVSNCRRRLQ